MNDREEHMGVSSLGPQAIPDLEMGNAKPQCCPGLERYWVSTEVERDWVLSTAIMYFADLEIRRLPSQRITARSPEAHDSVLGRAIAGRLARKLINRCISCASITDGSAVHVATARSLGFKTVDELLCLAAVQFVMALRARAKHLYRLGGSNDQLWQLYLEFVLFCNSRIYKLQTEYEEHKRRLRIDRSVKRDPRESYADWRARASPAIEELRPITLQFARLNESGIEWREDRSAFHRKWIEEQIAVGWQNGYRPFNC
jgi:hypothetical protein